MTPTRDLHDAGQSLWLDYITRAIVHDGTLAGYIDRYTLTGLTSNPTIFDGAIRGGSDYDEQIGRFAADGMKAEEIFFELAIDDLRAAADLFAPIHERSDGVDGWVSLEVSPLIAHDAASTIAAAASLAARAARDNLFIKIPGTAEGIGAITESIAAGVPVNVTLLFSAGHYRAQAEAYVSAIERRVEQDLDPVVASVASVFVSRWDVAVADRVGDELEGRLGIAAATEAYVAYRELLDSDRWQRLANEGARPQRLLFASTGVKDPHLDASSYVEALAAPNTVNTMPGQTMIAFAEQGELGELLPADGGDNAAVLAEFEAAGVDLGALATQLQDEGAQKFVDSWRDLVACIEEKRSAGNGDG